MCDFGTDSLNKAYGYDSSDPVLEGRRIIRFYGGPRDRQQIHLPETQFQQGNGLAWIWLAGELYVRFRPGRYGHVPLVP